MIKLSQRALIFNLGAAVVMTAGFVSFMRTTFARPYIEPCASRYHRQLAMRLDQDGHPLSNIDLQAVANGQDEGLQDHLTIAQFNEGPTKFAMAVTLAKGSGPQRSVEGVEGGISLPWSPTSLEQTTAACLSYDMFLPATFDFSDGGTLPGLFGTTSTGRFGDLPSFGTNLTWQAGGEPYYYVATKDAAESRAASFKTYEPTLSRGRWIHVDQELVLNKPGQSDGYARLWLDGRIESEVKTAQLRTDDTVTIAGVAGEIYFGGNGRKATAAKDETIWLSPFVIRWN